jgi:hypothetical protein
LQYLTKHWRYKLWGIDNSPETLDNFINGDGYGDVLNSLSWRYAHNQNKPQAKWWIDHTPENISYTRSLLAVYPQAKFIHIVRDGRAVASSIIPLDWGPNSIIKAARWWIRMTAFGLAAEQSLPSDRIIRLHYETLVQEPEATIRKLCAFLEVDFHAEMLDATGFIPPTYTTGQHQLVGRKPNVAMLDKWKTQLTPRQIELFEHQARDFLEYLDYAPQYGPHAKGPSFFETQLGKAQELIRGEFTNRLKWLVRSYPLWLTRDFYSFAKLSDSNN